MKIDVNPVDSYITLITETKEDFYCIGKIAAFRRVGTFVDGENLKIDISFSQLIMALGRED